MGHKNPLFAKDPRDVSGTLDVRDTPLIKEWQHYKGGLYRVIGVGQHTETGEWLVVYVRMCPQGKDVPGPDFRHGKIHIRPVEVWRQKVLNGSGQFVRRFEPMVVKT